MKNLSSKFLLILLIFQISIVFSLAQEKFDIVTFKTPQGWQKEIKKDAIQFTIEDASKSNYCAILLFKSLNSNSDSKKNFNDSWESLVKGQFGKVDAPQMQNPLIENGWTIESGLARFENNNSQGIALLLSATNNGKLVNLLILTNTQLFQKQVDEFITTLSLPKIESANSQTTPVLPSARKSNFKYNTTNFDNGWTAVEEADWVRATRGNITVLLHYPHPKEKETFYELEKEARTFWDLLVAPRYTNLTNFEVLRSDRDFEPARFAAGNVTDNATGKKVFVALFSKLKRGWIEVIAPDKTTFAREFGAININDEIINWKPLLALFDYNKFAVDASDLQGKWASNFSGTLQYANIYTGNYVGAVTNVSAESYNFSGINSYNWRIDAASSSLGRTNFAKAESTGKFSLPSVWQIRFSDIEGRPQTFPIHFSCVRGARILWVNGIAFGKIS